MIAGILPAAGRGTRFGGDKLLHPLPDGTPIAVAAARHLLAVLPYSFAVVRPGDRALLALLAVEGMNIVVNENADLGMALSLVRGVAAASDAAGWVIALADMPFVQPATIRSLRVLMENGAEVAAPVYRGRRGHPVGFSVALRDALLNLQGDVGARLLLQQHATRLRCFEVDDPGVLIDIDRSSDLNQ